MLDVPPAVDLTEHRAGLNIGRVQPIAQRLNRTQARGRAEQDAELADPLGRRRLRASVRPVPVTDFDQRGNVSRLLELIEPWDSAGQQHVTA
jgi:hypothetical protein